jgi:hypothetical protein
METSQLNSSVGPTFRWKEGAMRIDRWIRLSLVLGVLALLAVVTGHVALTDIYHAEGDVRLEWNVLRVCFAVIVASQVATLVTLAKVLRRKPLPAGTRLA